MTPISPYDGVIPTYEEAAEFFRTRMQYNVRAFTIQEDNKDVAGVLVIDGELSSLYVQHQLRNRGMATMLINMAKRHYTKLTLQCVEELIPFYKKHGFAITKSSSFALHTMEWTA